MEVLLPTEATGELLLSSNGIAVLCSGILLGNIGNEGEDETTELLTLGLVAISKVELSGEALSCTNESGCENPLVWAANLPWQTLAELMVDNGVEFFVDLLIAGAGGTKPGWYVECMAFIPSPTYAKAKALISY